VRELAFGGFLDAKRNAIFMGDTGTSRPVHQRRDADTPSSLHAMKAQQAALMEWSRPRGERYADLRTIKQPTLVVNGSNDIMVPTINSFTLSQHIPNSQLIIYPDSGHGALFRYLALFLTHTQLFLGV
jgi:pimeloyl-ACP methyl ester carboxylesterase